MMTQRKFLAKHLRKQLENTVKAARAVAERAAEAALFRLGVGDSRAPDYLSEEEKALRRRLRAHARALGDVRYPDDSHSVQHLVQEIAYQHWHRMLFARFLAENNLLLWEPGVPVSLAECEELVQDPSTSLGATSGWELAGKLAARMLPQIFRPESPVFEISFAPEHQRRLEQLLAGLPKEVFHASDSLGWVYQFWQAQRKDEINASGVKIGAEELPAVTQLFTEPYMVEFLLHNSLGAWWVTRFPDTPCPVELTYLRRLEDGTPAAGRFEGWPDSLAEFKLLDPCCGSGHFLVTAFHMLVPMRMAAEGLSAAEAVDAVLAQNLYGLEIDPRCVEIAVFALALAAWSYPDEDGNPLGVREGMPAPNIACCGLPVSARPEEWEALVPASHPDAVWLRQEMRLLHQAFSQAPLLGSLLNPARFLEPGLATPSLGFLVSLVEQGLSRERDLARERIEDGDNEVLEVAWGAQGLLEAARILSSTYHLVVTNVPYLAHAKQADDLKAYCERTYPDAKKDLANVFLERCLELSARNHGVVQIVMPQNWLFLASYTRQRKRLLEQVTWNLIALLGAKGFQTPMWDFNIQLLTLTNATPDKGAMISGLDASALPSPAAKADFLATGDLVTVSQKEQLHNPSYSILLRQPSSLPSLGEFCYVRGGITTGDSMRFRRMFWEINPLDPKWEFQQGTVSDSVPYGGREACLLWENGTGTLSKLTGGLGATIAGREAWGRNGIAISYTNRCRATLYTGEIYENVICVAIPRDEADLPALWAFAESGALYDAVRQVNQKLSVDVRYFEKAPIDIGHWRSVAREKFADFRVEPESDDPTQWVFHGSPRYSTSPLHVAVARLLGYRWPAELCEDMKLSDRARALIASNAALALHVDDDGIVPLCAVRGERPAHERLLSLLIDAWETITPGSWRTAVLDQLLKAVGVEGRSLELWLRDKFFEQHCKLFHHRPFIWHIWDGLRDGFGVLVNYHKLDAKNLERLIHTYLGDWIRIQESDVAKGVDGAEERLAAALQLKTKLEAILEGEAPYDIFVRWKPLEEQPIGWNPDLNDGVRINIRPFVIAGVLRHNKPPKLNIKWDKDRGKDPPSSPWYHLFKGERINDYHLTLAEKRAARGKQG